jgi:murein DD-endopeptidase MepM/ murein hydrolase activator NlpD
VHHNGIDLVAPQGEGIRAPLAGTVLETRADKDDARGLYLVIDHGDGIVTRYNHLEAFRVEPGQRVKRGEIVATVGNSGQSTGPHLHFEVLRANEVIDPQAWLGN